MSDAFTLTLDDREITDALSGLAAKASDLSAPLREIGEAMVLSTKQRFANSTGPDSEKWAENSPVTMERWLGAKGGAWKKSGALSKRGEKLTAAKKPLVAFGTMGQNIHPAITGPTTLEWGAADKQANVMQWGAPKRSLGPKSPWGDIPARPFLGLSAADRETILGVIERYLAVS